MPHHDRSKHENEMLNKMKQTKQVLKTRLELKGVLNAAMLVSIKQGWNDSKGNK